MVLCYIDTFSNQSLPTLHKGKQVQQFSVSLCVYDFKGENEKRRLFRKETSLIKDKSISIEFAI